MSTPDPAPDLADAQRLYAAGDFSQVLAVCKQILASNWKNARARHLLGGALARMGQIDKAISEIRLATGLDPNLGEAWEDLGHLMLKAGQLHQAVFSFQQAVAINPNDAALRCQLIDAWMALKEFEIAEDAARELVDIQPDLPEAHANLGAALHQQGKLEKAIASYQRAIELNPDFASAYANLADALARVDRRAEAETAICRAIEIDPANPGAWNNRATVMQRQDRLEESLTAARQAIELAPNDPRVHANAALALLAMGRFAEGWTEHEWRLHKTSPTTASLAIRSSKTAPRATWDGSPLNGRAIVLRAEQGFGDTIQFVRYAPMVRDLGGRVIVECDRDLKDLIATMDGVTQVIAPGQSAAQIHNDAEPPVEVMMMSLPHRFGTTLTNVPATVPYFSIDSRRVNRLRKFIRRSTSMNVGIVWLGNPDHMYDRSRSCPLKALSPLMKLRGIDWYSLHNGYIAMREAAMEGEKALIDLGGEYDDFAGLTAAMSLLDLTISVDTAPAHPAGALRLPVWTLLAQPAEWRWMRERDDSPWYPTMRLFRQPYPGNWDAVVRRVADALVDRLHSRPI